MILGSIEEVAAYHVVSSKYGPNRLNRELLKMATFEENDIVLDVGCGPGEVTRQISSQVNLIIGKICVLPNKNPPNQNSLVTDIKR